MIEEKRLLKVFLCHASGDKPPVQKLYKELVAEGVDAWLDQEKLLPGQDWRLEIPKAVQEADVVVICLSKKSVTKEGYIQKEIKFALDNAEEKPEGTIFLIPARLEDCAVPERLSRWQWVDLYEENGFTKLLRSLKLRADKVSAVIEPTSYETSDKELQRKLDQLYTDGLASFYTEDWDQACFYFQTILSERPNHRHATEKLAEAECQRKLAKLYERSTEAVQSENWQVAIETLEELLRKSADYKDAAQLLRDVRKREQLQELYTEARVLYAAQKWQAVVRVFDQISVIEPNFPDAEGFLVAAEKEVAEAERLAELHAQYSRALREMDSGNWQEARRLLEIVHKSQTGFLETEKLLRKVENEIRKEEEKRKQDEQIDTLYEQAHGLLRSKKWRKALDKLEEIQSLDNQFSDPDRIVEKAKKELECEEQEAEQQNKLAALYAEAVRLLKEEKYPDVLDKWREINSIDPKYPDRQGVQKAARKRLAETARPVQTGQRFVIPKTLWFGVGAILAIVAFFVALPRMIPANRTSPTPAFTMIPTKMPVNNTASVATKTPIPQKTNIPQSVSPLSTTTVYSDLMYDDFDRPSFDGSFNKSLWEVGTQSTHYEIEQDKGKLAITTSDQSLVNLFHRYPMIINKPTFFEARLFLDPQTTNKESHFFIAISNEHGYSNCGIFRTGGSAQRITCWSEYYGAKTETELGLDGLPPGWHMLRFEVNPETMAISYVIDGVQQADFKPNESIPDHFKDFQNSRFGFIIGLNNLGPARAPVGYVDFVRMGAITEDPVLFFDDFNGPELDDAYKSFPGDPNHRGTPNYFFEMLDWSTVLRLQNVLKDGEWIGWQTVPIFGTEENATRLVVRFNTLVQSTRTSIDGFLQVGLIDASTTRFYKVDLFAGGFGSDRTFAGKPFDFKDKTWYRLVLTGSKDQEIRAALCDDESGETLTEVGLGHNVDLSRSGVRIGIVQFMGSPGRASPTDVAIDWIRLSVITNP